MLKGKACMNCRRRKIKCDGDKPSCGQCAKSNGTFEDCEYPGPGPTQVQLLEERISHVQDRIRQLESGADHPIPSLSSYSGTSSPHDNNLLPSPRTPPRAMSSYSGSPGSSHSNIPSSPRSGQSHDSHSVEPPQEVMVILFDAFCRYSHHLGFFLNVDRFQESIFFPAAPGHYARPCPSLLNAVYLWGTHFAALTLDPSLGLNEDIFLKKALHHLPSDLASSHPRKVLHVLQAEVLLSYYHLRSGKALGGNYHANAAVSLFLSSGIHHVFSPPSEEHPDVTRCPSPSELTKYPITAGMVEGEYGDTLCAVLSLNAIWVTMQESHSMIYDLQDIGVDSPGIMDKQLRSLYNISAQHTVDMLNGPYIEKVSFKSLLASSTLLLEDATNLGSTSTINPQFSIGLGDVGAGPSTEAFHRLDGLIDAFKTYFPLLLQRVMTRADQEMFLVIQMTAEAAVIKLHTPRAIQGDLQSRSKSLFSAHALALLMENATRESINGQTVTGLFCSAACEVLARELGTPDSVTMDNKARWVAVLTTLYSQMLSCSGNNAFMSFLAKRLAKNHPEFLSFDSANL